MNNEKPRKKSKGQRARNQYQKELNNIMEKYARKITHNAQQNLKHFGEEMFKLNMKYFDMTWEAGDLKDD